MDSYARKCCPVIKKLGVSYHFSIMQIEYATDIIFRERKALEPLYERLIRTAIHAVKPDHAATFLGRHLTGNFSAELGNDFNQLSAVSFQVSANERRLSVIDAGALRTLARSATTS